jgi:uncharacterized protein YbaP (TraB family)
MLLEGCRQATEPYTAPLVERNRCWVSQIRARPPASPPPLVLVGALHLLGEQGRPKLLQRAGYTVQGLTCGSEVRE